MLSNNLIQIANLAEAKKLKMGDKKKKTGFISSKEIQQRCNKVLPKAMENKEFFQDIMDSLIRLSSNSHYYKDCKGTFQTTLNNIIYNSSNYTGYPHRTGSTGSYSSTSAASSPEYNRNEQVFDNVSGDSQFINYNQTCGCNCNCNSINYYQNAPKQPRNQSCKYHPVSPQQPDDNVNHFNTTVQSYYSSPRTYGDPLHKPFTTPDQPCSLISSFSSPFTIHLSTSSSEFSTNNPIYSSPTSGTVVNDGAYARQNNIHFTSPFITSFKTSPTSTNTRSIAAGNAASGAADSLDGGARSSLNIGIKTDTKVHCVRLEEHQESLPPSRPPTSNAPLLNSLLLGYRPNNLKRQQQEQNKQHQLQQQQQRLSSPVVRGLKLDNTGFVLDTGPALPDEYLPSALHDEVDAIIAHNPDGVLPKQSSVCVGGNTSGASLVKDVAAPHCSNAISPTLDILTEMKYETQSGPPTAPPHLTSSGIEPPHSSQSSGLMVGGSPDVENLLLSSWSANGQEFLEGGVPDAKQAIGLQETWDTIFGQVSVASTQSLAELKPLPPFTNYTANLSINGISGHHYHTIASSGQRSSIPSASPTSSSNQEYYESPIVSSSTPCPGNQKQQQQQNHQPQQQQQQQQHHHHPQQQQQQQQLPQSTHNMNYDHLMDEDIAEIISSAITADTTVTNSGNGPGSEQDSKEDWIDFERLLETDYSTKSQDTSTISSYSQIYVTTTPSTQTQQQHGSALQTLLTQGAYAPLLQARLQTGNASGLQNASCGETPSSTSPYSPLSPPNRVSTSCSPDGILHSSFAAPSNARKRSRSSAGLQGQTSSAKKNMGGGGTNLPYGPESGLIGKEKPIHKCHICQRGFLNKSNIKVHLRTHTGEKPFRCDCCGKAFRQKAHLIKHQQIHKRGGSKD